MGTLSLPPGSSPWLPLIGLASKRARKKASGEEEEEEDDGGTISNTPIVIARLVGLKLLFQLPDACLAHLTEETKERVN